MRLRGRVLCKGANTLGRDGGGFLPGAIDAGVFAREPASFAAILRTGGGRTHVFAEGVDVRFEQPTGTDQFHAANIVAEDFSLCWNAPTEIVSDKIVRRAPGGDDDGQAASHGFEGGHTKAFAAIRKDEAIAGAIKSG